MEVTSVHDAMTEAMIRVAARSSAPRRPAQESLTVRLDANKKKLLLEICRVHGATPSDFLRSCVDGLVRDYVGERASNELDSETSSETPKRPETILETTE